MPSESNPITISASLHNLYYARSDVGITNFYSYGNSLVLMGDLDSDGIEDYAASSASKFGGYGASAPHTGGRIDVISGQSGTSLYHIQYDEKYKNLLTGYSMTNAGDMDNDGHDDLLYSQPSRDTVDGVRIGGLVHLVSGKTGESIRQFDGNDTTAWRSPFGFGCDTENLGDVDGDGFNDFAIGFATYIENNTMLGKISVVSGHTGQTLYDVTGSDSTGYIGHNIALAGDVNNDNVMDFLASNHKAGYSYLYSGATGEKLAVLGDGISTSSDLASMLTLGDINNDGHDDFAISTPDYTGDLSRQGKISIYSGSDYNLISEATGTQATGLLGRQMSTLELDGAFRIIATERTSSFDSQLLSINPLTGEVSHVLTEVDTQLIHSIDQIQSDADFNGDGINDLLISDSWKYVPGKSSLSGTVDFYLSEPERITVSEHGDPAIVYPHAVTINLPDGFSPNQTGLLVSVSSNAKPATDVLMVMAGDTGLTVSGNTLSSDDITFATFSGGSSGSPLRLIYNEYATQELIEKSVNTLAYQTLQDLNQTDTTGISFSFTDADGIAGEALTVNVEVTPENDAPVMQENLQLSMGEITEDISINNNSGTYLKDLIDTSMIIDPDGDTGIGIAFEQLDHSNGLWELSEDNGENWISLDKYQSLGSTALITVKPEEFEQAIIRFVPNKDFVGEATVTFRAYDGSEVTVANTDGTRKLDQSATGGTSYLSQETGEIRVTVTPENDAPVLVSQQTTYIEDRSFTGPGRPSEGFAAPLSGEFIDDINQDGIKDFIHTTRTSKTGIQVEVLSGSDFNPIHTINIDNYMDSRDKTLGDWDRISGVGDINNDGYNDFAISYNLAASVGDTRSKLVIYSGQDASTLFEHQDKHIIYASSPKKVVKAGDINNDGYDDIIVRNYNNGDIYKYGGSFKILSGQDQSVLFEKKATYYSEGVGYSASYVGDRDGDGFDDIGVSIIDHFYANGRFDSNSEHSTQPVFNIYSGQTGEVINSLEHEEQGVVSMLGDINNDGHTDYALYSSRPGYNGMISVFSGADNSLIYDIEYNPGSSFGDNIIDLGDINNDEHDDFLISASGSFIKSAAGELLIYSGINGTLIQTLPGEHTLYREGYNLSSAGDLNNDGMLDFSITHGTAYRYNNSQIMVSQRAEKVFNPIEGEITLHPEAIQISDDNGFDGAKLSVSLQSGGIAAEDILAINTTSSTSLSVSGNQLFFDGTEIATFSGGSQGANLEILFNSNASNSTVESVFTSISYNNSSDEPAGITKTVRFELTDQFGAKSNNIDTFVVVNAEPSAPELLSLNGDTVNYTHGQDAVLIDSGSDAVLQDKDNLSFPGGQLTVHIVADDLTSEDIISIKANDTLTITEGMLFHSGTEVASMNGGSDSAPLVISFNDHANSEIIEDIIHSIQYDNSAIAPLSITDKTIAVNFSDGTGLSAEESLIEVNVERAAMIALDPDNLFDATENRGPLIDVDNTIGWTGTVSPLHPITDNIILFS